jgi:predicted RecB family nuclease
MNAIGIKKECEKGHSFYKSSDCPVCPICETERKPKEGFLVQFSAPARRAFENAGIQSLEEVSKFSEKEIRQLHGLGNSTLAKLHQLLEEKKWRFRDI